jgi:hypothetical protein
MNKYCNQFFNINKTLKIGMINRVGLLKNNYNYTKTLKTFRNFGTIFFFLPIKLVHVIILKSIIH